MPDQKPDQTPPVTPAAATGARSERGRPRPFSAGSLVAVVLLLVAGWLMMNKISENSKLQDCIMAGRKNCSPLDPSTGR